jgi:hypothetical protein
MKIAAMITMAAIVVASAQGKPETGRQVTVYFSDQAGVPSLIRGQAQNLASAMFASIGVTVHWRLGSSPSPDTDAIVIELVTKIKIPVACQP